MSANLDMKKNSANLDKQENSANLDNQQALANPGSQQNSANLDNQENPEKQGSQERQELKNQLPSPDVRNWLKTFGLAPNEDYMIDPSVNKVSMGLGWEEGRDFRVDVDASAALFDGTHNVVDMVWWYKLKSSCKSVKHSGDNQTGEGKGDDEVITVDIADIPLGVHHILFAVCIYSDEHDFSQLSGVHARMINGNPEYKGHVMWHFEINEMRGRAMLMGLMTRKGEYWNFKALGIPATGHTIKNVVQDPSNLKCVRSSTSYRPHLRHVKASVIRGRQLIAKDFNMFRKTGTSDPYFVMTFGDNKYESQHIAKTLDPEWNGPPFHLGMITATQPKDLKIEVYDYDFMSQHDFMGCVCIPASTLYNVGPGTYNLWYDLEPGKEENKRIQVSGKILLSVTVVDV